MKPIYKFLLLGLLFFTAPIFSQEYVKYIVEPPKKIQQKSDYIYGAKVKYNIPTSGYLYLTLFKDSQPIGNSVHKVTRGKRELKCDIFIWDGGKSVTRKGVYEYRLEVFKGEENDFNTSITKAPVIRGVEVVKKL